jgi:hypothetical protein
MASRLYCDGCDAPLTTATHHRVAIRAATPSAIFVSLDYDCCPLCYELCLRSIRPAAWPAMLEPA